MKFYGDALMQQNAAPVLNAETSFPSSPTAGRFVFVDKRVWMCVEVVSGQPTWIPMTNEINMYIHDQATSSSSWTVTHNLNSTGTIVQIYDSTFGVIIPDSTVVVDNNTVTVGFGVATTGRAVVFSGEVSGAIKRSFAYEFTQASASTSWTINHNLGYYPIVHVFVGSQEIQPQAVFHTSKFQTQIVFSTAQSGIARLL